MAKNDNLARRLSFIALLCGIALLFLAFVPGNDLSTSAAIAGGALIWAGCAGMLRR